MKLLTASDLTLKIVDFSLVLVDGEVGPSSTAVLVNRCPIKRSSRFLLCVVVAKRRRLSVRTNLHSRIQRCQAAAYM